MLAVQFLVFNTLAAEPDSRDVIPTKTSGTAVSPEKMQAIYEQVKTPFKYGVVLRQDGMVYHFYCAVGDQGRVIALATSKNLKRT
jgi:hypothetical protein